jgi:hypothetical protein
MSTKEPGREQVTSDPYLELTDEAVQERAVQARSEARRRREVAATVATWVGTLRDLAESRRTVTLLGASGRVLRGVLVAVGTDHVAIALDPDGLALLRSDRLSAVRPEPSPDTPPAMGDRSWSQDRPFEAWLEHLLELDERVGVVLDGSDEVVHGRLLALGEDVATLRLDGQDRGLLYARVASVSEVLVPGAIGRLWR